MSEELSFSKVVAASSISGITSRLILHPIDTIKARLQVQSNISSLNATNVDKIYKNSFDAFKTITKYEGVRGLYRGMAVALAFTGPANAMFLGSYDLFKDLFSKKMDKNSFSVQFSSGFMAEALSCVFWVPHDVMKERLQVSRSNVNLKEVFNVVKKDGIVQLYKGYWITLGTFGPNSALYFFGYERMKEFFKKQLGREELPFYFHLLSASVANSFAAVVTNPLDVIKTRFQVQRRSKEENNYRNFSDAFSKILKGEGFRGFYRGLGARILYSAPNSAIIMMIYEYLKIKLQN